MCTVIAGVDVMGPGTVVLGANRDEDPKRPSDPPRLLIEQPAIEGGRDRVAGGTWLAIRERRAAVAMLNRRPLAGPPALGPAARAIDREPEPKLRSRGLVTLDVASAEVAHDADGEAMSLAARAALSRSIATGHPAPFALAFFVPGHSWVATYDRGRDARIQPLGPGWHVLTHAEPDDPSEPRTARLLAGLTGWAPRSMGEAEEGLLARLALHEGTDGPAVCIHDGPMVTVSSAIVALGAHGDLYRHIEGRPCEAARIGSSPPAH